jgi:hypothetical protein
MMSKGPSLLTKIQSNHTAGKLGTNAVVLYRPISKSIHTFDGHRVFRAILSPCFSFLFFFSSFYLHPVLSIQPRCLLFTHPNISFTQKVRRTCAHIIGHLIGPPPLSNRIVVLVVPMILHVTGNGLRVPLSDLQLVSTRQLPGGILLILRFRRIQRPMFESFLDLSLDDLTSNESSRVGRDTNEPKSALHAESAD